MRKTYYAVPLRREGLSMTYNPLDGHCAMAASPLDAHIQLGLLAPGEIFAVWPLSGKLDLVRAGELCSLVAPLRAYVVLDSQVILPLASTVIQDACMETSDADAD